MIRLGLVGNGSWGRNYIRTIAARSDCALPADAVKTRNYKELLIRSDIDGVIIATPAHTHYRIATDFLNAGFPVLIEKPLALRATDAISLDRLAKRKKIPAMVGHIFRYHKHMIAIQKKIASIGVLQYILAESMDAGPIRKDISALWDWGPHDVSTAIFLLGRDPKYISAWDLGHGMVVVRISFPNGVEYVSTMGWSAPYKKRSVRIVGSAGSLLFDDLAHKLHPSELPLSLQVKEFISCIQTHQAPRTPLSDGVVVTKILARAEQSMRQHGRRVRL